MRVKEADAGYAAKRKTYTYQDYLELPADDFSYQVINGDLVMTPAPTTLHQIVSGRLEFALRKSIEDKDIGYVFDAPLDVILSEDCVVQPDLLFIRRDNAKIITEKNIWGAPDLVIEILSPTSGSYDLVEKKELYERFGVSEYWIVDPRKKRIEVYCAKEGSFEIDQRLENSGVVYCRLVPGFEVSLEELFAI